MTLDPTFPATVPVDAGATRAHRAQRTADLFDAAATTTDPQERTRLLEEVVVLNIPLADAVASRYRNRGIDLDDLTAAARLALVKASRRFDCGLGSDFADFATPTIRGEVRRYFRDFGWVVRPPRRIQEMQAAIAAAEGELNGRLGQSPRPSQLAEAMGADVADVEEALAARGCFSPTSLDLPVGERQDVSLADVLVDDASSFAAAEARAVLGPLLQRLSERDRQVLDLRFSKGRTQSEIAADIGVTQMQVSRLIARILRDLRAGLEPGEPGEPVPRRVTTRRAPTRASRSRPHRPPARLPHETFTTGAVKPGLLGRTTEIAVVSTSGT